MERAVKRRVESAERRVVSRKVAPEARPFGDHGRFSAVEAALQRLAADVTVSGEAGPSAQASELLASYVRRPGKRVRPYLCALGYDLVSPGSRPHGVDLFASALEMLHAFLLVHDDIIDRAPTRRGEEALHVQLRPPPARALPEGERQRIGADLGIVAGDWLYTVALEAMLAAELGASARTHAMREVLAVCRETARGQFDDVAYGARPIAGVRPADMLEVCRRKTARYTFEAPLVAGARLAGASEDVIDALRRFSDAAGIAFQLEDDLLGLYSPEEETGKPALADLREGKKTWPVLTAYHRASVIERAWMEELFVRGDAGVMDLHRMQSLVRRTGALEAAVGLVGELCADADAALAELPDNEASRELHAIVRWLETRAEAFR